jgi:hypothetical protein
MAGSVQSKEPLSGFGREHGAVGSKLAGTCD